MERTAGHPGSEAMAADIIAFCRASLSLHECRPSIDVIDALPRD